MASKLTIERFEPEMGRRWDDFVLKKSANGTILQTRRFLSYHPEERFIDASLIVNKGTELVAVVPAAEMKKDNGKSLVSHPGSTFGGIVVSKDLLSAEAAIEVVGLVDEWVWANGYEECIFKITPATFCCSESSSLEYALQHSGYRPYGEISFIINLDNYQEPVERNFTARRRRDCRYGEKAGCLFRQLSSDEEIAAFYKVLEMSLEKFDAKPVHTLNELLNFKNERLKEECRFYGVFLGDELIAGSMVFLFGRKAFHTQYLAANPDYLECYPMNYLDWNLIRVSKEEGFGLFSFGISTEEHGRIINLSLARFKDGFGGGHCINWTYTKAKNG